jgi:hypothetical protein
VRNNDTTDSVPIMQHNVFEAQRIDGVLEHR